MCQLPISTVITPAVRGRRGAAAVAVFLASLLAAACTGVNRTAPAGGATVSPGPAGGSATPAAGSAWQVVAPGAAGLSAGKLKEIAAQAERGTSNCLLVARYGKIAGEWYFHSTRPTVI